MPDFKGKKIALVGFGTEGRSTLNFLLQKGATVQIFDERSEKDFDTEVLKSLREKDVLFHFGALPRFDGIDLLIHTPGISINRSELIAAKEQGIEVSSATRIFFEYCPCPIIGVTGTKGKGTTSSLIYQMLMADGRDAYLCGNIGVAALDFLDRLTPSSIVVYELSSFQLMDLDKSPAVAVVLMVTSEHRDFHSSQEEYVSAKANILRFQNKEDIAIVNIDYPASREIGSLTQASIFSVSREKELDRGAYIQKNEIILATEGGKEKLMSIEEVPLAGAHNLENVCAAALATSLLGVPRATIAFVVCAFKSLPHRLELVREVNGVKYYDDSIGTTPESTLAAVRAFSAPKILILGGSSKGADWNHFAEELAHEPLIRAVVGVGEEWMRIKTPLQIRLPELKLLEGARNMQEIVEMAQSVAEPGDTVILSPGCASFGMFKNYQDRGDQFAEAVRALVS